MENRVFDNTRISCFQECRKKYYWRHIRHLEKIGKKTALYFGSEVHNALDIHYVDGNKKAVEYFGDTYVTPEGEEIRTKENGVKMLEWYGKIYASEPFEIVDKPESGFVFEINEEADSILYGGRIDLLVEWGNALWIVEHKTTTAYLNQTYINQFLLDKQPTGYIVGVEAYTGKKVAGCLMNVLQPWKDVQRVSAKTKRPEDRFMRFPITRSDTLKERFKLNVARITRDILWCEENNEFYETERKEACVNYNSKCPYFDLCYFGEDERTIQKEYEVKPWEPFKEKGENENGE